MRREGQQQQQQQFQSRGCAALLYSISATAGAKGGRGGCIHARAERN